MTNRNVMVPVKEENGSLPGNQEERVSQFSELGEDEEEDPEATDIVRPCGTHGCRESCFGDHESDFNDSPRDTDEGEDGKCGIPGKEGPLEVEWLPRPHVILTSVYAGQVGQDSQVGQLGTSDCPFLIVDDGSVTLVVRVEEMAVAVACVIAHCDCDCVFFSVMK